jgi:hypothetical protein
MSFNNPKYIGILLGVLYGISIRILWDLELLKSFGGLVTISFMFFVPAVIGFIRVYFECRINNTLSYTRMITVAWQPIFIFLLVSVFTLLEGSICVAMALPAFMFFSSIGGLVAGYLFKFMAKRQNSTLCSVALLPLFLAPIEINFLHLSKTYQVENSIIIAAPVEVVWHQLTNVRTIEKNELPYSITRFIGVPSPIEANMDGEGVGAIRVSRWGKGVTFKEVITDWVPNQKMAYFFDIDPNTIPDNALDKHVKLGGEYFTPLYGEYEIKRDKTGNTVLHLKTTLQDNTSFGVYSRIWGDVIFQDFHLSLLKLMKSRAETFSQTDVALIQPAF